MRKSNSNTKHIQHPNTQYQSRPTQTLKSKTLSTIMHTQNENQTQQQTTKKNSLNKINSCNKIGNSSSKSSNSNLIKIQNRNGRVISAYSANGGKNGHNAEQNLIAKNQQLISQNKVLREQFCKLQQLHLKDKSKIQLLIGRMSQIKQDTSLKQSKNNFHQFQSNQHSQQHSACNNKVCQEKRKNLQLQLHKQRIKVYELEQQKRKWDKSRQQLKNQYSQLLHQIHILKQRS